MRGLIIKKRWLDLIIEGVKTWEIRNSNCRIRERIGLIQSGSGHVMGCADLVDSISLTLEEFPEHFDKHRVPIEELRYNKIYAWVLANPKKLTKPIPYDQKRGAIKWVKIQDIKC